MNSGKEFHTVFAASPLAVCLVSAAGRLCEANPAAQSLLPGEGWIGRELAAAVVEGSRPVLRDALAAAARAGVQVDLELLGNAGAGGRPVRGWISRAGPDQALVVLVDVTAERVAARERQNLEALFRRTQEMASLGWFSHDVTTGRIEASEALNALYGIAANGPVTLPEFMAVVHPGDRERVGATIARVLASGESTFRVEYRVAPPGLPVRDFVALGAVTRDAAGQPRQVFGTVQDVSAQKRAAERIWRLNRTYAVLTEIGQLIARERRPEEICAGACTIAVKMGGFPLAWLGLRDSADGPLRISGIASAPASMAADVRTVIEQLVATPVPGCAYTAKALREGVPAACNDVAEDGAGAWWCDEALQRGFRALVALPIRVERDVVGTFNLYATDAGYFNGDEMVLLQDLAADIGFALELCAQDAAARRVLERLRESEERFRQLAETIEHVFWIVEPNPRRLVYVSPAYEKVWQRPLARLQEHPREWLDAVLPEDRPQVDSLVDRGALGEYDVQYRIRRPDGAIRWIRDRAYPVYRADGTVARIVGIARDITEQMLARLELRAREEYFRCLIEQASDLITVVNAQGDIRFQSPAIEAVTGTAAATVLGRNAFELIHPDDRAAVQSALRRAVDQPGVAIRVEFRIRRADGEWRLLQASGRAIGEHGGEPGVVLNSRDVTDSRNLEEQLRHAQKMEAIGRLAGGVAHDFNNILAAIRMQTDLTDMVPGVPAEARDGLEQIRSAAERAANLTRQLLLFSRRQFMQLADVDLNEIVTSLAKMLQRIIGEDVRLQINLHPSPLWTRADAGMLDQVLMNLSVNARDAMPSGGRLVIETAALAWELANPRHPDLPAGCYVGLVVTDTGSGIAPDVLPRIFEPFFTTKESGKGTGLGLATVFGIVQQHGGSVRVDSVVGQGSRFEIVLPATTPRAGPRERIVAAAAARGGSETILVAEDDAAVRFVTRAILERFGYQVLEAATGAEALALWREGRARVSLLLTDLVMPAGVSGHELARQIQASQPDIRVIYTSGYSVDIAGRNLPLRPGEDFLQKPFAPEQLLSAVRRALDA